MSAYPHSQYSHIHLQIATEFEITASHHLSIVGIKALILSYSKGVFPVPSGT